ncbi:MAG: MFS transporter [Firmicutes bacterium]|nr:MFS transporter [Bacillota bacterium]
MKRDFYGWKCAIGCFIISFCHSGIFYALPTLYPYFLEKLGVSMTMLSVSSTISTVSGTLAAFAAAPLLDKLGARKMFLFGTFSAVSYLVLMAFADDLCVIWIAMALSGVTMSFGLRAACVAVINAWFVDKRSTILGVIFAAMTLGGSAVTAAVGFLFGPMGQRGTFLVLAAAIGVACLLSEILLIKNDPATFGQKALDAEYTSADQGSSSSVQENYDLKNSILAQENAESDFSKIKRSKEFLLLALAMILTAIAGGAYNGFGNTFLMYNGLTQQNAATVSSFVLVCSTLGSILLGALADKKGPRAYTTASLGLYTLGLALTIVWNIIFRSVVILVPMSMLCAFGIPSLSIGATVTPYIFGRKNATSVNSRLTAFTTVGSALCSIIGGVLYDATGVFIVFFGLSALIILFVLLTYIWMFRNL